MRTSRSLVALSIAVVALVVIAVGAVVGLEHRGGSHARPAADATPLPSPSRTPDVVSTPLMRGALQASATPTSAPTPSYTSCGSADVPVKNSFEVAGISCAKGAGEVGAIYSGDQTSGGCSSPASTASDGTRTYRCSLDGGRLIAVLASDSSGSGSGTGGSSGSSTGSPTLGVVWAPNQQGYGTARPSTVFNGGDPTGEVTGITWSSWGGSQAVGRGTAEYVADGQSVAEGHEEPATIVAFDLGSCAGAQRYRAVVWYFPQHGESFQPRHDYDLCTPAG